MGRGYYIAIVSSIKQKLNTHSSTKSVLVGVDNNDMMPLVAWSCYFLMA